MDLADRLREAVADRYAVERELGRGGMAVVYLARDLRHGRRVAIKVLRPELAVTLVSDRFLREIQIAAQLQHPLIVPLYDSGGTDELLWYVMPFIDGENLRERLQRERQLPLEDALALACDAAAALQCAHEHGFVHRDIKPENILLSGGHAMLADFGIARALTRAAGEGTSSGVAIGTPAYMSPEQAAGGAVIDERSDIYSLGCVVFEMLAGEPPFTGPTPQAVIARQVSERAPSVRVVRPALPQAVEETLYKALAKTPADRFATVTEFAGALTAGTTSSGERSSALRWLPTVSVLAVAAAAGVWAVGTWGRDGRRVAPDTSKYVILPFEYEAGLDVRLNEAQLLRDALSRWTGIGVVDPFQVREALARVQSGPLTHPAASKLARELGAGRYVRGTVSRLGDSLRVQAGLFDAGGNGSLLGDHALRLLPGRAGVDSQFALLVDRLLFRELLPGGTPTTPGTRSLPARQWFARGQRAIESWDLASADSAFSAAGTLDPLYAQAHLWVALARAWGGAEVARWRVAAEQAGLGRERLSERDQLMSDAVLAQARGDLGRACPTWQRLTAQFPRDFAAWYGWAHCQSRDDAVIPDAGSPSGWSFRTSYHRALVAYERAFELRPSIIAAFRTASYEPLRRLLLTSGNQRRLGYAPPPDTTSFRAAPAWRGDSLALVPYPAQTRPAPEPTNLPSPVAEAVRHQRLRFREIALAWVATFPENADAMEALAISLLMLGDASALDTLRRARALARDPGQRLRVSAAEVWTLVAFSVPGRTEGVRRARVLTDSLLADQPAGASLDPFRLAGLAALTGRAKMAASYIRESKATEMLDVPPALRSTAPALLVYSALGGPVDSLVALEREVRAAIHGAIPPGARPSAELKWLARPATLVFPAYRFQVLRELAGRGDYLLDLQVAWAARDTVAVQRGFSELAERRSRILPANRTLDALYPEAELLSAIGDHKGAVSWLDPTLAALPQVAPEVLAHPVMVASLVRALALRARLAEELGDRAGAAQWASAVTILWADADPFLQPVVRQLRRLAM